MKQNSTRVSSKHKADLQQKHRNLSLKRKKLLALWDQTKKPTETAKSVSFVKEATLSIISSFYGADEETGQIFHSDSKHKRY